MDERIRFVIRLKDGESMARQIGAYEVATLLSHTLGEEESADCLLTEIAKPLLQQATAEDLEGEALVSG